jgi:hypothetical protein
MSAPGGGAACSFGRRSSRLVCRKIARRIGSDSGRLLAGKGSRGGQFLWVVAVAATLLGVAGCGIPQFVFIAPPVLDDVVEIPPTMTFHHDPANDTDAFLGYEVYYKFYLPATAAGHFTDDRAMILNASPGTVITTLAARQYRRVHVLGSEAKPLIRITPQERGVEFTIRLEFQQESHTGGVARWSAATPRVVELVRDQRALGLPTPPVGYTRGELSPQTAYPDLPGSPDRDHFQMGLAVVSYGIDYVTGTFGELYSTAIMPEDSLQMGYQ